MTFAERAADLQQRGFSLIPLQARDKKPILGVTSKTRNADVIASWAEQYPDANVGVVADDEFVILDADNADKMVELTGRLNTYTVQSSPGKAHFYFRRNSFPIRNLELGTLGSLRAENMYVVGAGSIHPKTGEPYRVVNDAPVATLHPAVYRGLEIQAQHAEREVARITANWDGLSKIPQGMRQYFLRSQAGKLWDGEKPEEELFAELQDLNEKFCDPAKDESDVYRLVSWVMTKEPNIPGAECVIGAVSSPAKLETPAADVPESKAFQFVLAPLGEEIEGPFALRSVSLIAGSSGSAKSTWAYDMLAKQQRGEMVLGRKSYGRKALVIMHDRSEDELERTFRRMGIKVSEFPFVTITAAEEKKSPAEVVHSYMKDRKPVPEVVLIEGLDMWARQAGNMEVATDIMRNLRDVAQHYNVAIVGTVGCPKQKPKEKYALARDKVFGSQAWGRRADTIIVFAEYTEPDRKGHQAGDRDVHVLLRNAPEQRVTMRFQNGLLVEVKTLPVEFNTEAEEVDTLRKQFERWVGNLESFTMADASEANPDVSYHTLLRWAKGLRNGWRSKKTQTGLVFRQSRAKAANAN
jgi:Bifunctional DNA primase/polymerase, N-terminal/AAA domain